MNMKNIKHPSYAMLSFHRVRGGNPNLYGSSVPHDDKIQLVLKHSSYERDLHREWYFGGKVIAEAEMSYSQFAEAIVNMNAGDGIPCTLLYTEKDGPLPDCDFKMSREQYTNEFKETLNKANEATNSLIGDLQVLFKKQKLSKADKDEIMQKLNQISMNIGTNAAFVLNSFNEQMDKSVMEAKTEVEAFTQHKLLSLGLENIQNQLGTKGKELIDADEKG